MAELLRDLTGQLTGAAKAEAEAAKQLAAQAQQKKQEAAPAFESGRETAAANAQLTKEKGNSLMQQAVALKHTAVSKLQQARGGSSTTADAATAPTTTTTDMDSALEEARKQDPNASKSALAKERMQAAKGQAVLAKNEMLPVKDHAVQQLQPEVDALKGSAKSEAEHAREVAAAKAQRAAEVATEKAKLAQQSAEATLRSKGEVAGGITQSLRTQTGGILNALGDAADAVINSAHHTLAAASRTNDDLPADNGMNDGTARAGLKQVGKGSAAGYQTGKQQASAALDVTSDHTGKFVDVGKETVFELGDKADRNLDPLAQEVKGAVVSNAEQAHDKHGRLVAAGVDKAHPLTDKLADTARETTVMTHEKAKQGADHAAATDLEQASGIRSGAVNPKAPSTGYDTASSGINNTTTTSSTTSGTTGARGLDPAVGAYGTTFDEVNPLHASPGAASRSTGAGSGQSGGGFASFPDSTVYPGSGESVQGDSATGGLSGSSSNSNTSALGTTSGRTAATLGATTGLANATSSNSSGNRSGNQFDTFPTDQSYPQDAPQQSLAGSGSSSGTRGFGDSTTTGSTTTSSDTNATAEKASGAVNKFKEDALASANTREPQGTVGDAKGAASLLATAARAGKEEYQRTDGSQLDTKQHGQRAATELTDAAKGLQGDMTGGTPEGQGASSSTEQSTVSAAKTAGAALKSAVTDYKTHKDSRAAAGDDAPKKTEVLKAKALETFDKKGSEEDKRAAAIVQEEATRRAEVAKQQSAAAKARAAELKAEAERTAELAKHDASAATTGVKGALTKAHKAKTDEKATKAILQSADQGVASAQALSDNLTTGLIALKQSLSGGMATTKDTVVEGINTADAAKRGEGDIGFVAQHAQQRYSDGSAAGQSGLAKAQGGLEKARGGAAHAGAAAQGGAGTASQQASEGAQSGKEKGYDKAYSTVQQFNDPERKGQYADQAKQYADKGLDAAHSGISTGQDKTHSTIDSVAPRVDAKGHVVIDQAAGTVQSGIDTAASQGHSLIGTGLTTVDQQGEVAKAVVDQKLTALEHAAKEKEELAKQNIKLAADVGSVFLGVKPNKKK